MSRCKMVPIGLLMVLLAVSKSVLCCESDVYEIIDKNLTWSEAFIQCKQKNLILATIESQEDQDKMDEFLSKCNIEPDWDNGLWLSLRQTGKRWGDWYWVSNGIKMAYKNWGPGQPDGKRELCTQIYIANSGKFKWNNVPCEKQRHLYRAICQKPKCDDEEESEEEDAQ